MPLQPYKLTAPVAEASFLDSDQYLTDGITLDAAGVAADANGDKIIKAGTVIGKLTAGGLARPYDNVKADGTEVARGVLMHTVNLRHGNEAAAILTRGRVKKLRLFGYNAAVDADLPLVEFR